MNDKISELKARLSAYLAAVRRGKTVTILDRKTPIAQITPLADEALDFQIVEPSSPVRAIGKVRGVRPKRPVDVVDLLVESRGKR